MAGPAPKTRNWTAHENAHKPKGLHVIVSGQVEVGNTNLAPHLKESPERNPKHLGLALTIGKTGGPGLDVMVWKNASFHKEVKANQFDSVTVRWDHTSIAEFPVIDDREHGQHLAALTAAANAKHGKKPKKAAAKKPAAKKAAAKKKAPKAVGGWAKGKKAKKTAKKTAKKAAKKKPAKKKKSKRR